MSEFAPFENGEATRDGHVVTSLLSTKPGYRIVGVEAIGETLLSVTFHLDDA